MAGVLEAGEKTCIFNLRDVQPFKFASVGIWNNGVALLVLDDQARTMTAADCRYLADILNSTADKIDDDKGQGNYYA
jgi:hypothetical protein